MLYFVKVIVRLTVAYQIYFNVTLNLYNIRIMCMPSHPGIQIVVGFLLLRIIRVSENTLPVRICVSVQDELDRNVALEIATSGGTADGDIILIGSTEFETEFPVSVNLIPPIQFTCRSISILDDNVTEGTERVELELRLADPELADIVTISPSQVSIEIVDNDIIVVGFVQQTLELSESATVSICISIMEGELERSVLFEINQVGGSAEGNILSTLTMSHPFYTHNVTFFLHSQYYVYSILYNYNICIS